MAVLDGTLSTDPQNDIVSYVWDIDGTVLGSGSTLQVELDHVGPGPETSYTINLTVTDSTGCSSTDTVEVTVYDNHAPAIVGGRTATLTRQCLRRGGGCDGDGYFPGGNWAYRYAPWVGSNSIRATDNCDELVGLTVTRANPNGSSYTATYYNDGTKVGTSSDIAAIESIVYCVGNTDYYYSTTDLSGNSITAQRRVRVVDTRQPSIACPANAEIPCSSWDSADLSPAALGSASSIDRCTSGPAITYSDGAVQVDECWSAVL